MALPMVHLLAAWSWAQDKPELRDEPDYYLGAIAPDAIHVRDGNDKSHKNEVHLNNWRRPDPQRVLAYWLERRSAFDIGYGIHVLLDGQWASGFRRDFPQMLLPDGKPDTKRYYNDTLATDFGLHRESPLTAPLFDLVRRGEAPADHPMLTKYEFEQWRRDTFAFYRQECPAKEPAHYLDREYTLAFLQRCGQLFSEVYRQAIENEPKLKGDAK